MYDDEEDGLYLEDVWNDVSLNRYTYAEVVEEAVTILCYEYIEKNKGKRPTKKMINEWVARLIKEHKDE